MSEKKAPRLTPEQNEARQASRSEKRERARDARLVAQIAAMIWAAPNRAPLDREDAVALAREFLLLARAD